MKKIVSLLIAGIVSLFALVSCNLDKDTNCTFSFQVTVNIQDEDVQKEIEEYMKVQFVERQNLPTYYGKVYNAKEQFINYFAQAAAEADAEYIQSRLQADGDFVSLMGVLRSDYGVDWLGTRTWTFGEAR